MLVRNCVDIKMPINTQLVFKIFSLHLERWESLFICIPSKIPVDVPMNESHPVDCLQCGTE